MNTRNIKYNQKFKLLLATISLLICISFIKETYAKYITEANANANITVAKWKILVNNQDIVNNNNITETISPKFTGNSNIKDDVIAPGATGYFDLIIDPTNTDVTFSYEITSSINENSSVKDLYITGYSINDNEEINFNDEEQKIIKDTIFYAEDRTNTKIRVYISWQDGENETMDNIADTSATMLEDNNAKVDVNIKFIQTPKAESQTQ
jgi:hypothetical protein